MTTDELLTKNGAPPTDLAARAHWAFGLLGSHDLSHAEEIWADDAVDHFLPVGDAVGRDGIVAFFEEMFAAIPDLEIEVERVVASEPFIVVQWKGTGSFVGGSFQGVRPTVAGSSSGVATSSRWTARDSCREHDLLGRGRVRAADRDAPGTRVGRRQGADRGLQRIHLVPHPRWSAPETPGGTRILRPVATRTPKVPKHLRVRRKPEDGEREILDAAEKLLETRDFRDLKVDDVMKGTGMVRSAFYNYFENRNDLVLRLVQRIEDEMMDAAATWLDEPPDDPVAAIEAGLLEVARVWSRHGRVLAAVHEASYHDREVERSYRGGLIENFIEAVTARMQAENESGRADVEEPEEVARALLLMNATCSSSASAPVVTATPRRPSRRPSA